MPHYMLQAAYTAEALATLVRTPQDRRQVIQATLEKLGGKMEGVWLSFGEYDVVVICSLPDNAAVAAFALAAAAGGALRATKTTPLLDADETAAAMRKAAQSGYKPPK